MRKPYGPWKRFLEVRFQTALSTLGHTSGKRGPGFWAPPAPGALGKMVTAWVPSDWCHPHTRGCLSPWTPEALETRLCIVFLRVAGNVHFAPHGMGAETHLLNSDSLQVIKKWIMFTKPKSLIDLRCQHPLDNDISPSM